MGKRLIKAKNREKFSTDVHRETLNKVGLSRIVAPKEVPVYLIPEFGPFQKQVNELEKRYRRRAWAGR